MTADREPSAVANEAAGERLDAMALEFCLEAFKEFGIAPARIKAVYAPIVRGLLDHAVADLASRVSALTVERNEYQQEFLSECADHLMTKAELAKARQAAIEETIAAYASHRFGRYADSVDVQRHVNEAADNIRSALKAPRKKGDLT